MKLIAHRANVEGPNPSTENKPEQIISCIEQGYDVEIDVRYDPYTNKLWLGHDEPQYMITWYWLAGNQDRLWIHCKDITTLHEFSAKTSGYNYFWHQEDDYTLTSKQKIWAYPGKTVPYFSEMISVAVMPESTLYEMNENQFKNFAAVCTDYVNQYDQVNTVRS